MGKILDFNQVLMLFKSLFKPSKTLCLNDRGFLKIISIFFIILGDKPHIMGLWYYVLVSFAVNLFLQEAAVKKKYGGMLPKKPPLISKVTFLS